MKWKMQKLADICTIKTGKLDSNAAIPGGEYPFFTCAPETFRINTFTFDTEAVLLAGNNASGIFPLKYYEGKFDAYQRTYVLESIYKDRLMVKFLYYTFILLLEYFQSVSIGAATQYLTKIILNNLSVPIPPMATQEKIVFRLSAYDDMIENNRRRMALLEEAARLLYQEWFVHLRFPGHERTRIINGVPEGWERKTLGDQINLFYGKSLKSDMRVDGPFPVYGSSGIVGTHEKALVKGPAIIVGRKGNVGSVYWSNKDFYAIDTVFFINAETSNLYLYFAMKEMHFISTDGAVPGLNRDFAYSRSLIVPAKPVLQQFYETAEPLFNLMESLQQMNQKLRSARDLLLPRLMSGEIAV